MTNSTDKKTPKKQGPIRFGAIIPAILFIALFCVYAKFFFDSNMKSLMEWGFTHVHGAEVNVARVKTSFLAGRMEINDIQVTDKSAPERNLIQVKKIALGLLWDGLLRAKFVVEEASIEAIEAYSLRKKPGKILPKDTSKKNTILKKTTKDVLDVATNEFSDNALGEVAALLSGADPKDQLKKIQGELKTEKRIKELEEMVKVKEDYWKQKIEVLGDEKRLKDLERRAKNIKIDKKNPLKALKGIKEASKVAKEAKNILKEYKVAGKDLKKDIRTIEALPKEIDRLVDEDVKSLEKKLKIPDINVGDFTSKIFGKIFQTKVDEVKKYAAVARKYLPPKFTGKKKEEKKKEETFVPRKRGTGETIKFPITVGYPLFWLKKANVSSKSGVSKYSGDLEGSITDVSSNPVYLGKPSIIKVKGDFPHQSIMGLNAKVVVDHTTVNPKETINASIESYPVGRKVFSKDKNLTFGINGAKGQALMNGTLINDQLELSLKTFMKDTNYLIEAKNKHVKEMLTNVINGMPAVNLLAKASGDWNRPSFSFSSNLGKELGRGIKKELKGKVNEAKQKLRNIVDNKIGPGKEKLKNQISKVKQQVESLFASKKQKIDETGKKLDGQVDAAKKKQKEGGQKKIEDKAKKVFDALKGKFKF